MRALMYTITRDFWKPRSKPSRRVVYTPHVSSNCGGTISDRQFGQSRPRDSTHCCIQFWWKTCLQSPTNTKSPACNSCRQMEHMRDWLVVDSPSSHSTWCDFCSSISALVRILLFKIKAGCSVGLLFRMSFDVVSASGCVRTCHQGHKQRKTSDNERLARSGSPRSVISRNKLQPNLKATRKTRRAMTAAPIISASRASVLVFELPRAGGFVDMSVDDLFPWARRWFAVAFVAEHSGCEELRWRSALCPNLRGTQSTYTKYTCVHFYMYTKDMYVALETHAPVEKRFWIIIFFRSQRDTDEEWEIFLFFWFFTKTFLKAPFAKFCH